MNNFNFLKPKEDLLNVKSSNKTSEALALGRVILNSKESIKITDVFTNEFIDSLYTLSQDITPTFLIELEQLVLNAVLSVHNTPVEPTQEELISVLFFTFRINTELFDNAHKSAKIIMQDFLLLNILTEHKEPLNTTAKSAMTAFYNTLNYDIFSKYPNLESYTKDFNSLGEIEDIVKYHKSLVNEKLTSVFDDGDFIEKLIS